MSPAITRHEHNNLHNCPGWGREWAQDARLESGGIACKIGGVGRDAVEIGVGARKPNGMSGRALGC